MKIYVSGSILADIDGKFKEAQDLLSSIGFEVVSPLNNGLTKEHSLEQHMIKNFELMLSCEAIYLFDNWQDYIETRIEYQTAIEMNKNILFESNIACEEKIISIIKNAIHESTGMKFDEYTARSRKCDYVFARMIFVYHCRKNNMKLLDIAKYVHRDHSSVTYMLKKYDSEKKFNLHFRVLAEKVESFL